MLGDLMGNMEEKQQQMKLRLQAIIINEELDGIQITANGAREILNIKIDSQYQDPENLEKLEDLMVVAINNVLEKIETEEAKESQNLISDMLPPGMSGLFGG